MVMRSVGDEHEPRGFSVFAPMVIAGIGKQAETVEDRSIIIELKRKKPNERTESFRTDRAGEADVFARKSARWAKDNSCSLTTADPSVPDGLYNRAADNWRPEGWLAQLGWIRALGHEGGLFFTVGRRT